MPNHIHVLLRITQETAEASPRPTLMQAMAAWKSLSTRRWTVSYTHLDVYKRQDLFRAPWRKRERPIEEAERVPAPGQVPEPGGVLEAVLSLPESYRLPVHLFYYEGLSIREIAGVLGKREGAVRTSLTPVSYTHLDVYKRQA